MTGGKTGFWANAFQVPSAKGITKEEKVWLEAIGKKIVERGMTVPAILFLESTKPLQYLAGQAARFADPIFSLVVPAEKMEKLAVLLEKRDASEVLIKVLESHER